MLKEASGHTIWISLFLWSLVAVIGKAYITLHDNQFVGPDKQLEESLTRRMAIHDTELLNLTNQPVHKQIHHTFFAGSTRRFNNLTRNTPKLQVLYLIKFIIYSIQNRLEDFEPIVAKYQNDERIRIGHIFCKLDLWRTQMQSLFITAKSKIKTRFYEHLYYYQHILAVNIDVTYTIEFLVHLQNAIGGTEIQKEETSDYSKISQSNTVPDEIAKYKDKNLTEDELKELEKKYEASGGFPI